MSNRGNHIGGYLSNGGQSYRRGLSLLDNYRPWSRALSASGGCFSSFIYLRSCFLPGVHPAGQVLGIINRHSTISARACLYWQHYVSRSLGRGLRIRSHDPRPLVVLCPTGAACAATRWSPPPTGELFRVVGNCISDTPWSLTGSLA